MPYIKFVLQIRTHDLLSDPVYTLCNNKRHSNNSLYIGENIYTISASEIFISLRSDGAYEGQGFHAEYQTNKMHNAGK